MSDGSDDRLVGVLGSVPTALVEALEEAGGRSYEAQVPSGVGAGETGDENDSEGHDVDDGGGHDVDDGGGHDVDDSEVRGEDAPSRFDAPAADVLDADPDVVVAGGDPALYALVRAGIDVPVVPFGVSRGLPSIPADAVDDTLRETGEWLADGSLSTDSYPVVGASVGGEPVARALADVTLVTADAANISEFGVTARADLRRIRADGVVIATPAGSPGYANAVGGPVLDVTADVVAVVPIAPFETDPDHWIAPLSAVAVRVERDEATVTLLADDRAVGTVDANAAVTLSRADDLQVVLAPLACDRLAERELERH